MGNSLQREIEVRLPCGLLCFSSLFNGKFSATYDLDISGVKEMIGFSSLFNGKFSATLRKELKQDLIEGFSSLFNGKFSATVNKIT